MDGLAIGVEMNPSSHRGRAEVLHLTEEAQLVEDPESLWVESYHGTALLDGVGSTFEDDEVAYPSFVEGMCGDEAT